MRHSISMILLSAGIVLSLAGCQKDPSANLDGKTVRFTASSSSPRTETRTAFSGDGTQKLNDQNEGVTDEFGRKTLTWERIDWKPKDKIMIASDHATVNGSDQKYATYTVASVSASEDGKRSIALLEEMDGSEELFFNNNTSYSFWGVYPAPETGSDLVNGTAKFSFSAAQSSTGTPETKTSTKDNTKTLTILQPDMTQAVMLGKVENTTSEKVEIDFYPAFTAFEFTLMAKDSDIDLKSLVLESSKALTGSVTATIVSGEDEVGRGKSTYTIEHSSTEAITYTFPDNTKITKSKYLAFTVFALPEDIVGLTLTFNLGGGVTQKATLKQTVNGVKQDIAFAGCKKHCLTGIAVKGGWQFELEGDVLEWDYVEKTTSFSEQVQTNAFEGGMDSSGSPRIIAGAEEHTDTYKQSHNNSSNHYASFDPVDKSYTPLSYEAYMDLSETEQTAYKAQHPTYQYRYYQIRTLLMPNPGEFTAKFTPVAPYAGYWLLEPEGDIDMFDIYILDMDRTNWTKASPSAIQGQIMNHEVQLRIVPSSNVPSTRTKSYTLLFKAYFSSNIDFEPALSADSELQDVHGPGDFSYWLFTIPANN